jgi:hypothetical protein
VAYHLLSPNEICEPSIEKGDAHLKISKHKTDELVISLQLLFSVIPAKAGIQYLQTIVNYLDSDACPGHDPGFAGVTTFF